MIEPTIIDGVDVSGCEFAEESATTPKCQINGYIHCDGYNCRYKQLQRKTAECEELKEELTQEKLRNDDCYGQFKELRNKLQIATEALKAIQNNCKNIDVSLVLEQIESEEQ